MEVLLGDDPFPRLIEEYMGPDARRRFDGILKLCAARNYNDGYDDGYKDGVRDGRDE